LEYMGISKLEMPIYGSGDACILDANAMFHIGLGVPLMTEIHVLSPPVAISQPKIYVHANVLAAGSPTWGAYSALPYPLAGFAGKRVRKGELGMERQKERGEGEREGKGVGER